LRRDRRALLPLEYHDEGLSCDNAHRSLTAGRKLLDENVKIFIIGCLSGTKVMGPVAKRHGALLFSPGLLDRDVLAHQYPVINLATEIAREAGYLSQIIIAAGAKRIASLRAPDAFGEEFAERLAADLAARRRTVLNEQVDEQTGFQGPRCCG
jgi:ABC-type branched-subunit amino acid transport system substrate-binding protein